MPTKRYSTDQIVSKQRWTPSFGQLSGQVKVDSRFMFLSRFRLR